MAKRAPVDEKPFHPLEAALLTSVVRHVPRIVAVGSADSAEPQPKSADSLDPVGREAYRIDARPVLAAPVGSRFDQEKRVLYTREETQAIDRLVHNLAVRLCAQVKVSHVIRALTTLLLNAEGEVDRRAGEHGPLTRPPNGDFAALQRFEREITRILASAIRDAGTPR